MADPINKAELLERIAQGRKEFESLINGLPEGQLTMQPADGGWTVKDHLAHIAIWDVGIAALLRRESRWDAMGLTVETARASTIDALNAAIEHRLSSLSLQEVLALFEKSYRDVLSSLANLDEADLDRLYRDFTPSEPRSPDRQIREGILRNTAEHYAEHMGWIRNLLERIE